jgi:hypothetical protein
MNCENCGEKRIRLRNGMYLNCDCEDGVER